MHADRQPPILTLRPAAIARVLACVIAVLFFCGMAGRFARLEFDRNSLFGFVQMFDLDREANIPTWYSSSALLVASGLLAIIAKVRAGQGAPFARHWAALSLIFLLMSIDESAAFHDKVINRRLIAEHQPRGILGNPWVVPGAAFVGLVFIAYIKFLAALSRKYCQLIILSGAIYLSGVLVSESAGGYYNTTVGEITGTYVAILYVEETLEMAGVLLFIFTLTSYLAETCGSVTLDFAGKGSSARTGTIPRRE